MEILNKSEVILYMKDRDPLEYELAPSFLHYSEVLLDDSENYFIEGKVICLVAE